MSHRPAVGRLFCRGSFAFASLLAWLTAAGDAGEATHITASSNITASSTYSPQYSCEHAFDGDLQTRWASGPAGDQPAWLGADFGRDVMVDSLTIHWERAFANAYEICLSADRRTWQTIYRQPDNLGGKDTITGLSGRGRYLRIVCRAPGSWGIFSIWEVVFPTGEAAAAMADSRRRAAQAVREREQAARQAIAAAADEHGIEEIVFAVRQPGKDGHWYANFSYYADDDQRRTFGEGGRLCRLNLRTGRITALLDDPRGGVRDPVVHYEADKILFSYRPGGAEHYHLYEIRVDGSGLRQLTDGPYDDIEPAYLPDGGIVFVSSRCRRWVNCWLTQVAVLHRCDADGSNLRPLSANVEHDNTPWPLPDGRVLYQRWEYIDRSQVDYHHLWTANPDGTSQMVYYGNLHPGILMIDAKPIPGTPKVVAIFSPGHGHREHDGAITVIDPRYGPDDPRGATAISREGLYRDPWALSEQLFLAARGTKMVLLDGNGVTAPVYELPPEDVRAGLECHEPRPLQPRPRENVIPSRAKLDAPTGTLVLADIYRGRAMEGIERGEIKKLLVLESLPKPINFTGGMDPLTYGGSFTLERVLGTVPVQPDGSAILDVPALRSLLFVALDENDLAVKRMHSFATVQPGEVTGCVGCHEARTESVPARSLLTSLPRRPSRIEPIEDCPDVFDFPRDIQPILDRLCADCHGYEITPRGGPYAGRIVLSGDRGPMFSHAYFSMTVHQLLTDNRNRPVSNLAPRSMGSAASRILTMLDGSHYDVQATEHQRRMLRLWIDVGAPYPGTYAALGCGAIGGYAANQLVNVDTGWPTTQAGAEVIGRRCAGCHQGERALPRSISDECGLSFWRFSIDDPRLKLSRHIVFNLSQPERSLLLLAPLAPAVGGFGLCRDPAGQPGGVFAAVSDPDYQTLLQMVAAGRTELERIKRFDMPGFRPRPQYLRELRRYGILSPDHPADAAVDPYQLDRLYWESLWHQPGQ